MTIKIINGEPTLAIVLLDPATGQPTSGGGGGNTRQIVTSSYTAKNAFAGATVGDSITSSQVIDTSVIPAITVSTTWRNVTTATDFGAAPLLSDLNLVTSSGLTDGQLRATPVPMSVAALPLPTGAATAAGQATMAAALANIDTDIGAPADAAATTDAGTFSIIALIKRGLVNWTALLAKIPALVSGRMPVDGSGVTQPVSAAALPLPTGATTAATQTAIAASLANIDADLGTTADVAATADVGTFGINALIKRALANWTTLLARIPALVSGRLPVDGSGVTQPVSAASLPLPAGATTAANQASSIALLTTLSSNIPAAVTPGLLPVDGLASVGAARQLAAGATSLNTVLTASCRRITIAARGADLRYAVGVGAQTASAATHWIASGERLDMRVPANANIAVMRDATTSGVLEVSELA